MRTEIIETYSLKELSEFGYKEKNHEWYLGDSRWPTKRISKNFEHLLGRKFNLLDIDFERQNRKYSVETNGEEYYLPECLVKTKVKNAKTFKKIVRDEVAKFNGYGFTFPCNTRHLGLKEARELAEWVLKVSK